MYLFSILNELKVNTGNCFVLLQGKNLKETSATTCYSHVYQKRYETKFGLKYRPTFAHLCYEMF